MSSAYPRATNLSPSNTILSLGRQGMESLHCTSQDLEELRYDYTENRSESDLRRRTLAPMLSGYGRQGAGSSHLTKGNPTEDGYSSSDATVTAFSSNRSRLRATPSGMIPMQRRRQENATNASGSLTAIDFVKAPSNDRGHYIDEPVGISKHFNRLSGASGDQAVRPNEELSKRSSSLTHQDLSSLRPKPRANALHDSPVSSTISAGKTLDPTIYIPRSFSFDDVMDYPLSADAQRYTRTGVDLSNLVNSTTDHPAVGQAASSTNARKTRGIPRMGSKDHAGYDTWMESGSERSFSRRRLSEGSSSFIKVSQRPRMQRNISSDISHRSRPSQRDTSESEGASSPGDWDSPLFSVGRLNFRRSSGGGVMGIGRSSIPNSEWATSPFSEDDRPLLTAQSGTSLQPQIPSLSKGGTVLPALLLGLRLLAVVPAIVGTLNLLWQVAQSGTRDTQQLADFLAALPWVCFPCDRRPYAARPDSSSLHTGNLDRGFLLRAYVGTHSTLAGTLCSGSDATTNGLTSVTVLAMHLLYTSIRWCSRHVAGMDRRLYDNSLLSIDTDLGHKQRARPYTQDVAAAAGIPSDLVFRRYGRHGIL